MNKCIALLAFFFCGCHPGRLLTMTNKSGAEATISFHIKEDSVKSSPLFMSNSKIASFLLNPNNNRNTITMSIGNGGWTKPVLTEFVNDLEALEIHSSSGVVKLSSEDSIYDFLSLRRRGLGKSRIQINVQ